MSGFDFERSVIDEQISTLSSAQHVPANTEPPITGNWVRPTIQPVDSNRLNLGLNPKYRFRNILFVQIFTPANIGTAQANLIADELSTLFRDKVYSGIRFFVPQLKPVGTVSGWYQCTFSIEFYRED
jgi:hypothetical protein